MKTTELTEFTFSTVADADCVKNGVTGKCVKVPHTWNVDDETEEYIGCAYYGTNFTVEKLAVKTVILFRAVYRDAEIFVNGINVCTHTGSGYTPFEADITHAVKMGANLLVVKCDNSYSDNALPHMKAFDWANDGGIIRGVELIEYHSNQALNLVIKPTVNEFLNNGLCNAVIDIELDYLCEREEFTLRIIDCRGVCVLENKLIGNRHSLALEHACLWDTDTPNLYNMELQFGDFTRRYRFGIRSVETRGNKVYLNNRPVRLLAVEWMPGSNPLYGMAEPKSELVKNLKMLKELNCNFTRFHWQQDKAVYDWCDENGLLVQEEIPYWGAPRAAGSNQLEIAKRQAAEMLKHHFNHPSIVCWGVGNELDGWNKKTIDYVKKMIDYFKSRDNSRLVNYVSNSFGFGRFKTALLKRKEATYYGDICMWNEYMGTWQPTVNFDRIMRYVIRNTKGKPIVSTEFGLCEPRFSGGDSRRIAIYKFKLALYKKYDFAGWTYFCLNDYRTHVGESGKGKLKQRIHGSVTLAGDKKPSYEFIKTQNKEDKI